MTERPKVDEDIQNEEREQEVQNWHRFFYTKVYLPLTKHLDQ
jgi:hypothetical protein